jgi:hypothetical protein
MPFSSRCQNLPGEGDPGKRHAIPMIAK